MQIQRFAKLTLLLGVMAAQLPFALQGSAADLMVNGDFEATENGGQLRVDNKGQDWYESRKDGEGRNLLKLSRKKIYGNATQKAMIKGSLEHNTYFTQKFSKTQKGSFTLRYDILIKEIEAEYNRSAFCFLGGIRDKKGGPNSTGKERFVFLGFENADVEGMVNLFVREGSSKWGDRTIVARNMALNQWHTVELAVNVEDGVYAVTIPGLVDAYEVESFYHRGNTPEKLTHISFASWNDGPGTFYVDNVVAWTE